MNFLNDEEIKNIENCNNFTIINFEKINEIVSV